MLEVLRLMWADACAHGPELALYGVAALAFVTHFRVLPWSR